MKRTILLRTIIVMLIGTASGFVVAFSSRNTCGRRSLVTNGVGAVPRSRATGATAGVTGIVAPQPQHPSYSTTSLSLSLLTSSSNRRPGRPQQYRTSAMSTPSSSFSSSAAASLAATAAASSSPASSTNDPSGSARREGVGPRQAVIEARLMKAFAPITYLEVQNTSHGAKSDESHFKVIVVSETFAGTRLIGRHRAINKAVSEADDGSSASASLGFHSLEIGAAKTPDEWDANSTVKPSPKCQGTRDDIQYGIIIAMHLFSHFVIIGHR